MTTVQAAVLKALCRVVYAIAYSGVKICVEQKDLNALKKFGGE